MGKPVGAEMKARKVWQRKEGKKGSGKKFGMKIPFKKKNFNPLGQNSPGKQMTLFAPTGDGCTAG